MSTILTFPISATQEIKEQCLKLINERKSFSLTYYESHHWEIEIKS